MILRSLKNPRKWVNFKYLPDPESVKPSYNCSGRIKILLSPFLSNLSDQHSYRDHKLESKLDKEQEKKEGPHSLAPCKWPAYSTPLFHYGKEEDFKFKSSLEGILNNGIDSVFAF